MYRLTYNPDEVIDLRSGVCIDRGHAGWPAYQAWLRGGGVPEAADTSVEIRARAWNAIKSKRDRCKGQGVSVGGKWFHTDIYSRLLYASLVAMGDAGSFPTNLDWKTMDGSTVPMSHQFIKEVFGAVAGLDLALFAAAEKHRLALDDCDDPSTYDFEHNWPGGFQSQG